MERCPKCPWAGHPEPHFPVNASGPTDATTMLIGEAPGKEETKRGRVFIGKTGQELDGQYLPLAALDRAECYVTNAMKCYPPNGKLSAETPMHREWVDSCVAQHLRGEIERVRPALIVAMGAWAVRHTVGHSLDMEMQHGILQPGANGYPPVWPTYHPALGLHRPDMMTPIREDWVRLRLHRAGALSAMVDEYPLPDYRRVVDPGGVWGQLDGLSTVPLAIDTETTPDGGAFCLTFSANPGTGYLILATDEDALAAFAQCVGAWEAPVLIHNCLFDLPVLRTLGVEVPWEWLRDTMISAYHLGNVPQGLKALAYRYLGCQQQSFDDLVMPYARYEMLIYLQKLSEHKWKPPDESWKVGPDGNLKSYKAQGLTPKLKRLLTDYGKAVEAGNPDKVNLLERWKNWVEDGSTSVVTPDMGPFPYPSVTQVPLEDVIGYACRDADLTLRLWPLLENAAARVHTLEWQPEEWLATLDTRREMGVSCSH